MLLKKLNNFNLIMLTLCIINAFALPGGYIVINTGLILAAENPEEIAAVLAQQRAVFQQSLSQVGDTLVGGSDTGVPGQSGVADQVYNRIHFVLNELFMDSEKLLLHLIKLRSLSTSIICSVTLSNVFSHSSFAFVYVARR